MFWPCNSSRAEDGPGYDGRGAMRSRLTANISLLLTFSYSASDPSPPAPDVAV